jgi:hypothetical protein
MNIYQSSFHNSELLHFNELNSKVNKVHKQNSSRVFTRVPTRKNAQVVTSLQQTCSNAVPTTCQQDVFALLVSSLLTTCYKVVELNIFFASCSNNLLSPCNSTTCQQVTSDNPVATFDKITHCYNLLTCYKHTANTSC